MVMVVVRWNNFFWMGGWMDVGERADERAIPVFVAISRGCTSCFIYRLGMCAENIFASRELI